MWIVIELRYEEIRYEAKRVEDGRLAAALVVKMV